MFKTKKEREWEGLAAPASGLYGALHGGLPQTLKGGLK
jgi:hypothetical protein